MDCIYGFHLFALFLGIQVVGALPSEALYVVVFYHLLTTFLTILSWQRSGIVVNLIV